MKLTFFKLLLLMLFVSCTSDDEPSSDFKYEFLPIERVELPEHLEFGKSYDIPITYRQPNDCYVFNGYDFGRNGNERFVAVLNRVYTNQVRDCSTRDNDTINVALPFQVEREDYYIFKFWIGEDLEGNPMFLTKEVPVIKK